ncbi:MAG: hypothetical protein O2971_07025 [Proteobacteria bacterium]|nr:hypothetical protein [Pseudomonadota bacterium]
MQVADLSHFQFVRISGADTIKFLQGQLSCNIELLSPQRSLTGALCNLKGRVIADFRALQLGEACLLQTSPGMAEKIVATLAKYAVFSKVELEVLEPGPPVAGCSGEDAAGMLAANFGMLPAEDHTVVTAGSISIVKIPGLVDRFELYCWEAADVADGLTDLGFAVNADPMHWLYEDLKVGILHLQSAQSEAYTPQLLNFDISGVIDFKKGCYTGQEVVARMYYRGSPKKRLFLLSSATEIGATDEVVQQLGGEQISAEILAYHNGLAGEPGEKLVLAILDISAVAGGAVFALSGQAGSALELRPLPYQDP